MFDVVLSWVCKHLQEDIHHIRIHGQDEVLIYPQNQVPEHALELDGEDGHSTDDHHGDGIARQHYDHRQQGVDAEQEHGLHHRGSLKYSGHRDQEQRRCSHQA